MSDKIKVLVVDDSAFARVVVSKTLGKDPDVEIIGFAKDGVDAIKQVRELSPDVVTMDVNMPRMDGLEALGQIMTDHPTPVVMLSALTGEDTETTIEALEKGAVDFFLKTSVLKPTGREEEAESLLEKIKIASKVPRLSLRRKSFAKGLIAPNGYVNDSKVVSQICSKVLVIGSSTGGPKALADIVPEIPSDIRAAILIIQHMPAGFTSSLSQRLDRASNIEVKEAENGDRLVNGKALLAPGGYHLLVKKGGEILLNQDPKVCGVRPSVDVTMKSVAEVYGKGAFGVVLTGMGRDGTDGAAYIKKFGGQVAAEHESSCVVYGMPRSVIEAGYADKVATLDKMSDVIRQMCGDK